MDAAFPLAVGMVNVLSVTIEAHLVLSDASTMHSL